jgi:hypothetical protein
LTGRVKFRTFYGPPNYGENPKTDSRETQALLVLSNPVCVEANPTSYEEGEKGQRKITLVPSAGFNPPQYRGKIVTVEGTLFHAHTAHHHTPVLMQAIGIKKEKSERPNPTVQGTCCIKPRQSSDLER